MSETIVWYPDLVEMGNLWSRESVQDALKEFETEPPAELVFTTTNAQYPVIFDLRAAGWQAVGTQVNWSRWARGVTRVTVWAKHFPNCTKRPNRAVFHWNEMRGFVGFCCGVHLLQNVWTARRQLTIVRRPGHSYSITHVRMNYLGFRQFAQTRLATYYINGWQDADWTLAKELEFRGLRRPTWLAETYAYPEMPPVAA